MNTPPRTPAKRSASLNETGSVDKKVCIKEEKKKSDGFVDDSIPREDASTSFRGLRDQLASLHGPGPPVPTSFTGPFTHGSHVESFFDNSCLRRYFNQATRPQFMNLRHRRIEPFTSLTAAMSKDDAIEILMNYAIKLRDAYEMERFNLFIRSLNDSHYFICYFRQLPPMITSAPVLSMSAQMAAYAPKPVNAYPLRPSAEVSVIFGPIFMDAIEENSFALEFLFNIDSKPAGALYLRQYQCDGTASRILKDFGVFLNGHWIDMYKAQRKSITEYCQTGQNLIRVISNVYRQDYDGLVFDVVADALTDSYAGHFGSIPPCVPIRTVLPYNANNASSAAANPVQTTFGYVCLGVDPFFKDSSWITSRLFNQSSTNEICIAEGFVSIDLRCPLSLQRIAKPVRFSTCKHHQCFDYNVFKSAALAGLAQGKCVKCPVCAVKVSKTTLLIECGLMRAYLNDPLTANLNRIKVDLKTGVIIREIVIEEPTIIVDNLPDNLENEDAGAIVEFKRESRATIEPGSEPEIIDLTSVTTISDAAATSSVIIL